MATGSPGPRISSFEKTICVPEEPISIPIDVSGTCSSSFEFSLQQFEVAVMIVVGLFPRRMHMAGHLAKHVIFDRVA